MYPPGVIPNQFIFEIEPLGCVYLSIPKNGCRTIKRWLARAAGWEEASLPGGNAPIYFDEHLSLYARRIRDARPLFDRHFSFVFLRDPVMRLVSAFSNKFVQVEGRNLAKPVIERVAARAGAVVTMDTTIPVHADDGSVFETEASSAVDYERGVTFREFVEYVCETPDSELDAHWRPQARFVGDFEFDFVGDTARLSSDLARLGEALGVDTPAPPPSAQVASAPPCGEPLTDVPSGELYARGVRPGASALVTPELREQIENRYRDDLQLMRDVLARPVA